MTEKKKAGRRKRPETGAGRFIRTAKIQMRHACIPTVVAISTSVVLTEIGAPIVPLAVIGAGGYAWWRGYRIRVEQPGDKK